MFSLYEDKDRTVNGAHAIFYFNLKKKITKSPSP